MEQDAVFEEFGLNPEAYKTSGEDAEGGGAAAPDAGAGAAEEGGAPVPGSGTPAEESGAAAQEEAGEETRDGLLPNAEASEAALAEASRREKAASEAAVQARIDKIYADMFAGQVNPFTGQSIQTEADFRAYQQERERRQALEASRREEQALEEAGVQPDILRQLVDRQVAAHPAVQQAQQAVMAAARERAGMVHQAAEAAIAKSLQAIAAEFPEVKTMEDIAAMPTAGRFNELVQKGIPMEDAFFLANRQEIGKRQREASRQAAINAARGKDHLSAGIAGAAGAEAVEVPAGMAEAYREVMPGATDAEIRAAYAKYLKDMK